MIKLDDQFIQDRALRDSARAVIMADITHARTSFSAKGVADRVGGRIGDGAKDVFEVAKSHSDDKRGIIAVLIGAVLLWLAREPIMEILGLRVFEEEAEDENELDGELDNEPGDELGDTGVDQSLSETARPQQSAPPTDGISAAAAPSLGDNDEQ